jgi:hypothetical protein
METPADFSCAICGNVFALYGNWYAADELWRRVSGMGKDRLLCIQCFDSMADELGLELLWVPFIRGPDEYQPLPWEGGCTPAAQPVS